MIDAETLTVQHIEREIKGCATSITFHVPPPAQNRFQWQAGQHVTLCFTINGRAVWRSYTISSPPGAPLRITVKRVTGGEVSNFIADHLSLGDHIQAMPPAGGFKLVPEARKQRTHYFFASGSGITPIYAMIHALLAAEPYSVAYLIYGNTRADQIIFQEPLAQLAETYPARFIIRHVLSQPSMWSWFTPWRRGRIDQDAIAAAIEETPPVAQDVHYWICGPGRMNRDLRAALMAMDVPETRIHMEQFAASEAPENTAVGVAGMVKISLYDQDHEVSVDQGHSIFEAARQAGVALPHSCQSGICGACKAQLVSGQVHMHRAAALERDEIENGRILTCQSVPLSENITIRIQR